MKQIEDTFKDFTTREDIAVVLIVQFVRLKLCLPLPLTTSQSGWQPSPHTNVLPDAPAAPRAGGRLDPT